MKNWSEIMNTRFDPFLLTLGLILVSYPPVLAQPGDPGRTVFVQDGVAKDVVVIGKKWQQGDGYLECSGMQRKLVRDGKSNRRPQSTRSGSSVIRLCDLGDLLFVEGRGRDLVCSCRSTDSGIVRVRASA